MTDVARARQIIRNDVVHGVVINLCDPQLFPELLSEVCPVVLVATLEQAPKAIRQIKMGADSSSWAGPPHPLFLVSSDTARKFTGSSLHVAFSRRLNLWD